MKATSISLPSWVEYGLKDKSFGGRIAKKKELLTYEIERLKRNADRKAKLLEKLKLDEISLKDVLDKYPDLEVHDGVFCSPSIHGDINSVSTIAKYGVIYLTFSKKIDENSNNRIFLSPHKIPITNTVNTDYHTSSRLIRVLNYEDMINNKLFNIPQDVKTKAISKAKKAVVKLLTGKYFKTYGIKTQLDKSSHNYDYFSSMINFI